MALSEALEEVLQKLNDVVKNIVDAMADEAKQYPQSDKIVHILKTQNEHKQELAEKADLNGVPLDDAQIESSNIY